MAEPKIWMNGKLVTQAEAVLPVNSAAVFYATNVFEGLRAYWNETDDQLYCFRLDEHFARFRESMKMMRFTVPYSDADLHAAVKATLTGNANGALANQDNVTPASNDIIFVEFEAAPANNGPYVLTQGTGGTPYILTRHPLADTAAKLAGLRVFVETGSTFAGAAYQLQDLTAATITVGTTALQWTRMRNVTNNEENSYNEDFHQGAGNGVTNTALAGPGAFFVTLSGTATCTVAACAATEMGVVQLSVTTTTANAALTHSVANPPIFLAVADELYISIRPQIVTLSDGTNTFKDLFGLVNAVNAGTVTSGIYFLNDKATDAHWQCVCALNGTGTTTTPSTSTVTAGQWDRLEITKVGGGSGIDFWINGVYVTTIATANVPFGVGLTEAMLHTKSAGNVTARTILIDWYNFRRRWPARRAA
jgi:hypothetical protein